MAAAESESKNCEKSLEKMTLSEIELPESIEIAFLKKIDTVIEKLRNCHHPNSSNFTELQSLLLFFDDCAWQRLTHVEDTNCKTKKAVVNLCQLLYDYGKIRQFTGKEDVGYVRTDFANCAERSILCLQCIHVFLDQCSKFVRADNHFIVSALLLTIEHLDDNLWTNEMSTQMAKKVLDKIIEIEDVTLRELMCKTGLINNVMKVILPRFSSVNWKMSPSMIQVYRWCLFNVTFPDLSELMPQFLPPALLLANDHEMKNKIIGVQALEHIIDNCSKSELTWFGRSEVIYDSLQKLTYTNNPKLVEVLHPCFLKVIIIEQKKYPKRTELRLDEMLQRLLHNMQMENIILMRRTYTENLGLYIATLNINVIKHFNGLFSVVFSYLEIPDTPSEETRINMLRVLCKVIQISWPRIPGRSDQILKSMIKLSHQITTDRALRSSDSIKVLLDLITECLRLLKNLDPERIQKALNCLVNIDLGTETHKLIKNVLLAE